MNNNIYVYKKCNNFNKSKKDIRNIFTDSKVIHSSSEKIKSANKKAKNTFLNMMMMITMILIIILFKFRKKNNKLPLKL